MRDRTGAALVAAAALIVFALSLRNGFAYDDVPAIVGDPRVTGGDSWRDIVSRPYWTADGEALGLYRPLVTLGFAVDWALSGGSAAWFHAVNLLWNALGSVLVFLLLRRFFDAGAALAGALLFAVHPVHTEAVANVVGRAELMAATLSLGAGLVWLGARGPGRVAGSAALFAGALLSKESAVMVPLLLVLLDFAAGRWRADRPELGAYLRRNRGGLAALAGVLAGWLFLRASVLGGAVPTALHPAAEVARGPLDLLRTALTVWPEYVRLMLFPVTLLADYSPRVLLPATEWNAAAVLGMTVLIASIGGGALAVARQRGRTALGLLWFPIAVLPASNLLVPIGVLLAERTLYLPSFAVAVLAAGIWRTGVSPARPALVRAALALLIVLLAARSAIRVPEWRSTASIFAALERDRPEAYRAKWYHGRVARAEEGAPAAHPLFMSAVELWPYRKGLVVEAIANAVEAGRLHDARLLALHATRVWPDDASTHSLLAATSLDLGDTLTAARAVSAGLELEPADALLRALRSAIETPAVQ